MTIRKLNLVALTLTIFALTLVASPTQACIQITQTGPINFEVDESGTTQTLEFSVFDYNYDASQISDGELVLQLSSRDTTEVTIDNPTLTLTPSNWRSVQTITMRGVNDDLIDGDQTTTIDMVLTGYLVLVDGGECGPASGSVEITVITTDNDSAGVVINPTSVHIIEGGDTDTYTVVLAARPNANVTVTIDPDDQIDVGNGPGNALNLIFTNTNWFQRQEVTATAVDDRIVEDVHTSKITHSSSSSGDPNFSNLDITNVSVNITDNDFAGFTFSESDDSTQVDESATTDDFTVVLSAKPQSNVTIMVSSDDTTEVEAQPSTLIFTTTNWDQHQEVTVTGVDDDLVDGDMTTTITLGVDDSNSDDNFDPLPDKTVSVINADGDIAGVTITQSSGSTDITEDSVSDYYTIILDAEPIADVIIAVDPDEQADLGNGPGNVLNLTFTPSEWNTTQEIKVMAVDDNLIEDVHTSKITHSSSSSGDPNFSNLDITNVSVNITDNDFAGFTINESDDSTQVDELGNTDTLSVVLDAQPISNVVLLVASADVNEATVDQPSLTFTPSTWNIPFTVIVKGVDDSDLDGDQTTIITLAVSDANSDDIFDPLADQSLSVTILDDDAADLKVTRADDPIPDSCRVGDCSLREAIIAANIRFGENAIFLPGASYILAIPGKDEDQAQTGDLDINDDLTIIGTGPFVGAGGKVTIINGGNVDRVFDIDPLKNDIKVTLSGVTITDGTSEVGGGIRNFGTLTMKHSIIRNNNPGYGGGIGNLGGTLTLHHSMIRDNFAAGIGGGIYNLEGTVAIHNSTILDNNADIAGGISNGISNGGDIGQPLPGGTVTLIDSTVVNNGGGSSTIHNNGTFTMLNSTVTSQFTGGISNEGGTFTILNSTITNNRGTGVRQISGEVKIQNSIVAENVADPAYALSENLTSPKTDCRGLINSLGYNFIGTTSDCQYIPGPADKIDEGDPGLGDFEDPRTPGKAYFPLTENSPAIDTGDPTGCKDQAGSILATDQLGKRRPIDGNADGTSICDRGAIEFYPQVNQYVTFVPEVSSDPTGADPFGCPTGTVGKFRFNGRLKVKPGAPPLSDLIVQVVILTNGNILRNADGGPGGVGAILTVGAIDDFADRVLRENESVRVPFSICLTQFRRFSFFVNVLGEVQSQN